LLRENLEHVPKHAPRGFKPLDFAYESKFPNIHHYQQIATDIADQNGLDDKSLEKLVIDLGQAIYDGLIPTRDRDTGMLRDPGNPEFLNLVCGLDVNQWLEQRNAPYSWSIEKLSAPANEQPSDNKFGVQNIDAKPGWKMQVQTEAAALWLRVIASGGTPSVSNIKDAMAAWCISNNIKTGDGVSPKAGYLRTHVLASKHWIPPR
jgi:hypothetical protein